MHRGFTRLTTFCIRSKQAWIVLAVCIGKGKVSWQYNSLVHHKKAFRLVSIGGRFFFKLIQEACLGRIRSRGKRLEYVWPDAVEGKIFMSRDWASRPQPCVFVFNSMNDPPFLHIYVLNELWLSYFLTVKSQCFQRFVPPYWSVWLERESPHLLGAPFFIISPRL